MSLKERLARVQAVLGRPRLVSWAEVYPARERLSFALLAKVRALVDSSEPAAVDEAAPAEAGEVAGDLRLRLSESLDELADGQLLLLA